MKFPPYAPQHWLIFAVVAALFFAWGAWLMRPQAGRATFALAGAMASRGACALGR